MNKVCIVMGVGPGNGEAFVRRFSNEGFQVAMVSRSQDFLKQLEKSVAGAHAFPCDMMDSEQIATVLTAVESQLGPEKIHVANVVIDGVVDLPRTREWLADKPDDFFVKPSAVADAVWTLCQQNPSGWTFELDIRPFGETW